MKTILVSTVNLGVAKEGQILDVLDGTPQGVGVQEGKFVIALAISDEDWESVLNGREFQPQRYVFPLEKLPGIDVRKARDIKEFYQPYIDAHPITGSSRQTNLLFSVSHLIEDSKNGIH